MIDTMIFPTNLSPDNLIINSNFTYVFSTNKSIPYQAWKIHISATLDIYKLYRKIIFYLFKKDISN